MPARTEFEITTTDGLKLRGLFWRGGSKLPVICIPGLTRNAKDFENFAPEIADTGRNVFALSLRGRGRSDYDPNWVNYHPSIYQEDVEACLRQLEVPRAIYVGTSLGGIITMLTAAKTDNKIAAAVINDVGPRLAEAGLKRISGYATSTSRAPAKSLRACIDGIRAINQIAFPDEDEAFWKEMALRTFVKKQDGTWVFDYDQNIGRALVEGSPIPDLNPGWNALSNIPTLVVRGALSDLLSIEIIREMRQARPGFDYVEVERVGHAPMMTEVKSLNAIKAFLSELA